MHMCSVRADGEGNGIPVAVFSFSVATCCDRCGLRAVRPFRLPWSSLNPSVCSKPRAVQWQFNGSSTSVQQRNWTDAAPSLAFKACWIRRGNTYFQKIRLWKSSTIAGVFLILCDTVWLESHVIKVLPVPGPSCHNL